MARTKRTKRIEDEPSERIILVPALKRAADDIIEPRVFKIRKFWSGTMTPIDETRDQQRPIFLPSVDSNSKRSKKATTYLSLPLELRQQILYDSINDDIISFKEQCRADKLGEYEWYALQNALLDAKQVCLKMESAFRVVHPQVEQDFSGVLGKFEREVKRMAEVIMEGEVKLDVAYNTRWFANYMEWRRWM